MNRDFRIGCSVLILSAFFNPAAFASRAVDCSDLDKDGNPESFSVEKGGTKYPYAFTRKIFTAPSSASPFFPKAGERAISFSVLARGEGSVPLSTQVNDTPSPAYEIRGLTLEVFGLDAKGASHWYTRSKIGGSDKPGDSPVNKNPDFSVRDIGIFPSQYEARVAIYKATTAKVKEIDANIKDYSWQTPSAPFSPARTKITNYKYVVNAAPGWGFRALDEHGNVFGVGYVSPICINAYVY